MKLTNRQLYDYRDVEWGELRLIRVGHALWAMLRRAKSLKSHSVGEIGAIEQGIETIIRLKREYRAERDIRLTAQSAKVREHFAAKRGLKESNSHSKENAID